MRLCRPGERLDEEALPSVKARDERLGLFLRRRGRNGRRKTLARRKGGRLGRVCFLARGRLRHGGGGRRDRRRVLARGSRRRGLNRWWRRRWRGDLGGRRRLWRSGLGRDRDGRWFLRGRWDGRFELRDRRRRRRRLVADDKRRRHLRRPVMEVGGDDTD